jgi:hypothetical protein
MCILQQPENPKKPNLVTSQLLLSIAMKYDLAVHQFDVKATLLDGDLATEG